MRSKSFIRFYGLLLVFCDTALGWVISRKVASRREPRRSNDADGQRLLMSASPPSSPQRSFLHPSEDSTSVSRRQCLSAFMFGTTMSGLPLLFPKPTNAVTTTSASTKGEIVDTASVFPYSNSQLQDIVTSDIVDRQFLATGNLTRDIYKTTATFTDEIDTYQMDQWIQGTQRLFIGDQSSVRLVGPVQVSDNEIIFRFDEDLMFNIPFLRPIVTLTGTVRLERDASGFITSYREFWDQDTWTVLKTAKLGSSKKVVA